MTEIILGKRPYEHPDGKLSVELDRLKFLEAIEDYAADALQKLSEEPLARYLETGIPDLDLTRQVRDRYFGKFEYRDIGTFWHNLESRNRLCVYYVDEGDALNERYIHESCANRNRTEEQRLISEGIISEFDFLFETTYQHYLPCPQMKAFWNSLIAWAQTHNLVEKNGTKKWCLESAFNTLDWWVRYPQDRARTMLDGSGVKEHPPILEPPEQPEGLDRWRFDWEDEEVYIKRVMEEARRMIKDNLAFENPRLRNGYLALYREEAEKYCSQVRNYLKANNWQHPRERPKVLKHLRWAVLCQVNNKSYYSIEKADGICRSTVKREVEELIDRIGLVKNPLLSPQRRRASKDSPSVKVTRNLGR